VSGDAEPCGPSDIPECGPSPGRTGALDTRLGCACIFAGFCGIACFLVGLAMLTRIIFGAANTREPLVEILFVFGSAQLASGLGVVLLLAAARAFFGGRRRAASAYAAIGSVLTIGSFWFYASMLWPAG
jgi:hypothetical protein